MNEIITKTGSITCDMDAIKAYLDDQLSIYSGMLFTEDTKKQAKATVADLRKKKKEFMDRVKAVKAEYMKPYEEFLGKAQEISDLFDEPIEFINEQIVEFETNRIEEKQKKIRGFYEDLIGDMKDIIPFDKIFNPKWCNATYKDRDIKDEIMCIKLNVKHALEAIRDKHLSFEQDAIDFFLKDFDYTATLEMIFRREKEEQEVKERVMLQAERDKAEMEARHMQELAEAKEEAVAMLIPDMNGSTTKYEYRISLTDDAKDKLDMYLNSIGVEFDYNIIF